MEAAQFDQGKVWVTRTGEVVKIKEMTSGHRQNTIAWLLRNAEQIAFSLAVKQILTEESELVGEILRGRTLLDTEARSRDDEPVVWMEGTVLFQAMVNAERKYQKRLRKERARTITRIEKGLPIEKPAKAKKDKTCTCRPGNYDIGCAVHGLFGSAWSSSSLIDRSK